jgi:PAS domain S-box-containing protein
MKYRIPAAFILISIVYTTVQLIFFENSQRIDLFDVMGEGAVLSLVAFGLFAIQRLKEEQMVYKPFFFGLTFFHFAALTDVLDEFVTQPGYIKLLCESCFMIIAIAFFITGIKNWIRKRELEGKELNKTYENLESRIKSRTEKLIKTNKKLQKEIKERKLTEKKMKESEERYRALFESSPDGIAIADDKTRTIKYVNQAFCKMSGYSEKELKGMDICDIHPDEHKGKMVSVYDAISKGEKKLAQDISCTKKDGTTIYTNIGAAFILTGGKKFIISFYRDITENKILQMKLTQSQKLESIGQLAAGIAHEINTPMQYISDNTSFLEESFADIKALIEKYQVFLNEVKGQAVFPESVAGVEDAVKDADFEFLSEEIPKAIEQSIEGIERVVKIVGAMKEFSHPGTNEKTAVDINKVIESTITVSRNEWKYVSEVETDFDPTLPKVPCLPAEFNQVILNMIVNASHAISDVADIGSGSNGHKGTIKISTHQDGDYVEVRVSDTGSGIPVEVRDKIFDPFFTTKDVGEGTGQGLAIAHAVIVGKHEGELSFETEEGEGTTFIIRLPMENIHLKEEVIAN